eukprot:TRINITY_DN10115_c0_g1_i1.p1 TRINITY_DN10115_c0_g1~~TRINITY_DN10115_c0_g1_i1.p1  ORF type:complete len:1098 (-),score=293.89 TRINITY_DN10115_c0_g1_i1:30-3323(-)
MDASNLSPEEKKQMQKRGNEMIKQLHEMFPDRHIQVCVEAVKRSNLDMDRATEWILENPNYIPIRAAPLIEKKPAGGAKAKPPEPKPSPAPAPAKAPEKKPEPVKVPVRVKYAQEYEQLAMIYSYVPEDVILGFLEKYSGDCGRIVEELMERFPPPEEEEEVEVEKVEEDKGCQEKVEEEYPDFLASFVKIQSSTVVNRSKEVGLDEDAAVEENIHFDDTYLEEDDGITIVDIPTEEDMLEDWFVDPMEDVSTKKPYNDVPDLITKLYQEQADEEMAKGMQYGTIKYGIPQREPFGLFDFNEPTDLFRDNSRRVAKRYQPEKETSRSGQASKFTTTVVKTNDTLQSFLTYVHTTSLIKKEKPRHALQQRSLLSVLVELRSQKRSMIQQIKDAQKELQQAEATKANNKNQRKGNNRKQPNPAQSPKAPTKEPVTPVIPSEETTPPPQDVEDIGVDLEALGEFFQVPDFEVPKIKEVCLPLQPYYDAQQDELNFLRNYYEGSLKESECYPKRISIALSDPKKWTFPSSLELILIVIFSPNYPEDETPVFQVRSTAFESILSHGLLKDMESFINRKAQLYKGEPMISTIVADAEKFLDSYPMIGKEAADTNVTEQHKTQDNSEDYGNSLKWIMNTNYVCATAEELILERNKLISTFEKKYKLSPSILRVLFQQNAWDSKKVATELNGIKPDEIVTKVSELTGISLSTNSLVAQVESGNPNLINCPSCLEDYPLGFMSALPCGHFYCLDCLRDYLVNLVNDGNVDCIPCPGYKCKYILDEIQISSYLNQEAYEKYVKFLANAYVESHPQIKWCPAKGCNLALRQISSGSMVMCKCGLLWCWKCGKDGHWPTSCEQIKWWNDIYAKDESKVSFDSEDEAASVRWLLKFTQDCPKCGAPIQKNGGCNHMSCKTCRHQYCWVCLENWESSHYSCTNSHNVSNDERTNIINRIENNLTFRQFYLINLKARQSNDRDFHMYLVRLFQTVLADRPSAVTEESVHILCSAVEYNYLCRHILLHACILGKFMQEHEIKGSKSLKPELKRLATAISFLHSLGSVPAKKFSFGDLSLAVVGIKTAIREFIRVFSALYRQQKQVFARAIIKK